MRLKGKTALVTGAASGIGRATAILLAREGARVGVSDWDVETARDVAGQIGSGSQALALDVTSEMEWERTVATFGRVDILVANAGRSFSKPVVDMTLEEWRQVMAVNLDGVFLGVKHVLRAMRQRGPHATGSIVIVSSASGIKASPNASAYCASKAALRLFAKAVALECVANGDNIRVNTVHPSGVKTPMWKSMDFFHELVRKHGSEEAAWRALGATGSDAPLKRFATPEEIAHAILFLASDEASYITGAELPVDAGYTAG